MRRHEWLWIVAVMMVCAACNRSHETTQTQPQVTANDTATVESPASDSHSRPNTILIGGGVLPDSTQVQMEQDLVGAKDVLPGPHRVYFAGGSDSLSVQVQHTDPPPDTVRAALAELFAPRPGRDARYRKPALESATAATRDEVVAGLSEHLGTAGPPLLVWVAAHGTMGESPSANRIELWGGDGLTVTDLATLTADAQRPLRFVATSCFSGGFAELAFAGAQESGGSAKVDRCGLFATAWDLEASGCDANPVRRAQEGYGLHVLSALEGRARDGEKLPPAMFDFDGNGTVSLLEAHTRARIAGRGIDVPTTTSERWLRAVAPTSGPEAEAALPEEEAVIAALSRTLGLEPNLEIALVALAHYESQLDSHIQVEAELAEVENARFRVVAAEMLAKWPVIDDPWHPDFESTLRSNRESIEGYLTSSAAIASWQEAVAAIDEAAQQTDSVMSERALVERLANALETRLLARRLAAAGGDPWDTYSRLLTCERHEPESP